FVVFCASTLLPTSAPFPYTTLFRSCVHAALHPQGAPARLLRRGCREAVDTLARPAPPQRQGARAGPRPYRGYRPQAGSAAVDAPHAFSSRPSLSRRRATRLPDPRRSGTRLETPQGRHDRLPRCDVDSSNSLKACSVVPCARRNDRTARRKEIGVEPF